MFMRLVEKGKIQDGRIRECVENPAPYIAQHTGNEHGNGRGFGCDVWSCPHCVEHSAACVCLTP